MRNIKTALAATLCALLYAPFHRNPTFACIGAIFGMGNDMSHSWLNGGNRLFGTIIGGFIGMAMFRFYIIFHPEGGMYPLMYLCIFIGVVLLIIACRFFKWPGGIQPGGVVLCIILFNTPVQTYVAYSLNRMLDTGIGVIIAWVLNMLLPRHRVLKWNENADKLYHKMHSHSTNGFNPEKYADERAAKMADYKAAIEAAETEVQTDVDAEA
ncbi:MAG: FUSC family protein [Firmicutes bacterium]|nr:FUSC family protein [Bacillota bacterium]